MACTTDINDHWYVSDLLDYADSEYGIADDVRELLGKYYDADDDGDFGDDIGKDDPEFTIKVEGGDERCGYYSEDIFHVHLPSREVADELADILGGKVTADGTVEEGSTLYRITYRNEVYIKADSEEEAQSKFEALDADDLNHRSKFVELVSCEKQ